LAEVAEQGADQADQEHGGITRSMRNSCWAPIIRLPMPPSEGMKYSAPMVPSQA
jgi:hypothetical protein